MVVRNPSGAQYGLRDWLFQRVSAVYMLGYIALLAGYALLTQPLNFHAWHALFSQPWMRIGSALFWLCLCIHAWVGMRDILMDYIRHTGLRLFLQAAVIFVLCGYFFWAVQILWRV